MAVGEQKYKEVVLTVDYLISLNLTIFSLKLPHIFFFFTQVKTFVFPNNKRLLFKCLGINFRALL